MKTDTQTPKANHLLLAGAHALAHETGKHPAEIDHAAAMARGNLIAAAPELLKACQAALALGNINAPSFTHHKWLAVKPQLEAAIAKALNP